MADDVRVTNWPDSGSAETVAFKLWERLDDIKKSNDERLDLFVQCLEAARGAGRYRIKG